MAGPWDQFKQPDAAEGPKPWEQFQKAEPAAAAAPAAPLSRMDKFTRGMRDPIDGGAQLLSNMLPSGLVSGVNKANNWLADKTGLVARLPEGGVDQMVRQDQAKYEAQRQAQGESGFDGYRMMGNIASPANLVLAAGAPAAATLAGRVGVGAASGAVSGAFAPVTGGDYWDEKAKQAGSGALGGAVAPVVMSGLGRIASPLTSRNANLKLLRDEGVSPTIGQALGGTANRIEEKLTSVPVMGDMIVNARNSANKDFQKAAFNRALKPVGEELPQGITGRDALVYTENLLKAKYDDVLTKIGAVQLDPQFNSKVANLTQMVDRMMAPPEMKMKFTNSINELASSVDRRGYITSDAFKTLESSLGNDFRKLTSSQDTWDGKIAPAVKQLQEELRDMLKRQAGVHADDLKSANAGWANFKRVQGATSKIGADDGNFTPAQFQNSVRGLDKSKDKGAFARGSALGQDLGDAGKSVLGSKVPDSGTPGRLAVGGLAALGAGAVNPAIPVSLIGGAAAYTSPVQKALVAAIANRPQGAGRLAEMLRNSSPYLAPAGAQSSMGLLGLGTGQQLTEEELRNLQSQQFPR